MYATKIRPSAVAASRRSIRAATEWATTSSSSTRGLQTIATPLGGFLSTSVGRDDASTERRSMMRTVGRGRGACTLLGAGRNDGVKTYSSVSTYRRRFGPSPRGVVGGERASRRLGTAAPSSSSSPSPPFKKILIANRGEIACRIVRTCDDLSIPSVAIHSTADYASPHVSLATESVCVGPPASLESYLNVDAVCDAVVRTGSEAVHPGYGFLSENPVFAKRLEELGVKFVGPSSDAIIAMGDKIQSKIIAKEANVSTIPGYDGVVESPEHAKTIARDVGYPVMIKASAGGGGKGMRICREEGEVEEAYKLSKAEAASFFGDDRLLIERYVVNPHHIEFQILAGRKANEDGSKGELEVVVFPERECSIQRRNQKVLEESPSVLLRPETRSAMVAQVKSLARKVEYESAGTVEFLVDDEQNFYFLEMNTRLQVEHPVTELVSGVDLVEGMLHVAAGLGVPKYISDKVAGTGEGSSVPAKGHAIEARIYAEDPLRGFVPSTGPLVSYVEPPSRSSNGCAIRIDSGVVHGTIVGHHYDPMLSKLVAHSSSNRTDAVIGLGDAIDRYVIQGVNHNAQFVRDVLRNEAFKRGYTPTNFIKTHYPKGFAGATLEEAEKRELAVAARLVERTRTEALGRPPLPLSDEEDDGTKAVVCLGGMFGDAYLVEGAGTTTATTNGTYRVTPLNHRRWDKSKKEGGNMAAEGKAGLAKEGGGGGDDATSFQVRVQGLSYRPTDTVADVVVDGDKRAIQVLDEDESSHLTLSMYGSVVKTIVMSPDEYDLSLHMHEPKIVDTSDMVLSPMPGTLMEYAVEEGDHVEIGQELCTVEAMKMQNVLRSNRSGIVSKLRASVGSSLSADEVIIEFEKEEEAGAEEEKRATA